jgi:hypothetical protein
MRSYSAAQGFKLFFKKRSKDVKMKGRLRHITETKVVKDSGE